MHETDVGSSRRQAWLFAVSSSSTASGTEESSSGCAASFSSLKVLELILSRNQPIVTFVVKETHLMKPCERAAFCNSVTSIVKGA